MNLNDHTPWFHPNLKPVVQRDKQDDLKVLTNSFHLNDHTLGFHSKDCKV